MENAKAENEKSSRPRQVRSKNPKNKDNVAKPSSNFNNKKQTSVQQKKPTGINKTLGPKIIPRGDPLFKPKALSTKSTPLRNDPILKETILVDGYKEVTAIPRDDKTFFLDYTSYITMIEEVYQNMVRRDRAMQKYLSLSMFQYYCVILLWRRLIFITSSNNGEEDRSYENIERFIHSLAQPDEIAKYLVGIGNIVDHQDNLRKLALFQELSADLVHGIAGHFGRVDDNTHEAYETMPAPFVAYYRIFEDLQYTIDDDPLPEWDLPADLQPDVENPQPNRNLLGWDKAVRLTAEQRRTIEDAGIALEDGVPVVGNHADFRNINGLPVNKKLMNSISSLITSSKSRGHSNVETRELMGSQAMQAYIERSPSDQGLASEKGVGARDGRVCSKYELSVGTIRASSLFAYRRDRRAENHFDDLCYDGMIWDTGLVFASCSFWNRPQFRSKLTNIPANLRSFSDLIRSDRFEKTKRS